MRLHGECLNLDYPGMEAVKEAVEAAGGKDYSLARKEMASYIRKTLDADRFFEIPYEIPENIYKLPGESDAKAAERICNHTLVSVGVSCEYGKENKVDWEANPTYNGYKEWTWQLSRHNDIKLLAHEYNKTKNEKLAYAAAELMDSWMKQAVCPDADCAGYKTKCWRTIECGIRMGANWPYILFTFYKTPAFTDDLLIDWYKSVYEHGERLSKNHMTGNWLIMEMNGLGQIGILYPQSSAAMPWSGFAALRTGWEQDDTWALMDAAPFGKAHQHEDKLSVLLYVHGKFLLTEGGNYAYDESEMRSYVLSTRSHNTVRVDGQDQNRRKTYAWKEEDIKKKANLEWNFSEKWDYAKSAYDEGYGEDQDKAPVHERAIYFYRDKNQPLLITVDRLSDTKSSTATHDWDILWHIDSEVEKQTDKYIRFADTDIAWSNGETTIIAGQETPEWQGFIATGTKQGMYRAVPCVDTKVNVYDQKVAIYFYDKNAKSTATHD